VIKAVDAYNAARSNWDALRIAKAAEDEIKTALQTMNSKETEAMALLRKGNGAASIRIDNAHVTRWVEMLNARSREAKSVGKSPHMKLLQKSIGKEHTWQCLQEDFHNSENISLVSIQVA
jgi:hypothetical protein